ANSWWWVAGALLFVATFWLHRVLVIYPAEHAVHPRAAHEPAVLPFHILVFGTAAYAVFLSAVRLVVLLAFVNRFFRLFPIRFNPLHPDGWGGFAMLGKILTVSLLVAVGVGIAAVAMAIASVQVGINPLSRMETVLLGAAYLVFTPLLLVGFLRAPHAAMLAG